MKKNIIIASVVLAGVIISFLLGKPAQSDSSNVMTANDLRIECERYLKSAETRNACSAYFQGYINGAHLAQIYTISSAAGIVDQEEIGRRSADYLCFIRSASNVDSIIRHYVRSYADLNQSDVSRAAANAVLASLRNQFSCK